MTTIEQIKQLEATINEASKQIEELKAKHTEAAMEIEKWSPKSGKWAIDSDGDIFQWETTLATREFGTEYQTEEQAIKARDAMRKHNRLLAWLSENDDGWVADWDNKRQEKYFVYYDAYSKNYKILFHIEHVLLIVVYMSKANAKKLCDLLNRGIVEL